MNYNRQNINLKFSFLRKTIPALLTALLIISLLSGSFLWHQEKVQAQSNIAEGIATCVAQALVTYLGEKLAKSKITETIGTVSLTKVPTIDASNLAQTTSTADSTTKLDAKEFFLDKCVKSIAKSLIDELTGSTITWVNTGFEGESTFVTNSNTYYGNLADQTASVYLNGSGLDYLCVPQDTKTNIQVALRNQYSKNGQQYQANCPQNIASLTGDDFSQIGWDGWLQLTSKDENNIYGSWVSANIALDTAIDSRINTEAQKLDWGNGFKSITDPETGNINTPGSIIMRQADRALGSNLDELQQAKEFDDIMFALLSKLTDQLQSGKGLRGGN